MPPRSNACPSRFASIWRAGVYVDACSLYSGLAEVQPANAGYGMQVTMMRLMQQDVGGSGVVAPGRIFHVTCCSR